MTNREELLNTNEYDLLLRIQEYMGGYREIPCVIEAISQVNPPDNCGWFSGGCSQCIQEWLNAKTKNRGTLK